MQFIDLHNHFAWDIDDGVESKEMAMNALSLAQKEGVTKIISTPHFIPGKCNKEIFEKMTKRMQELQVLAKNDGIDVYMGSEVFLNDNYLDMIDDNLFYTLANSGYVLCEFDVRKNMDDNNEAEDILYEFTVRDMIPVIAHVERYFPKGIDIERVEEWVEQGYVIQINRTSLFGKHGEMAQKNAWKLLKMGLVHVVASDAHQDMGNRVCKFQDVFSLLEKELGRDNAEILCYRNPLHIIENEEVEDLEVIKQKKSLFGWLKRR